MSNPLKNNKNIKNLQNSNFINNVNESVNNKFCMVSCSQRCDCGYFKPDNMCMSLDICHNCMWARSPYDGSEILYCSKKCR